MQNNILSSAELNTRSGAAPKQLVILLHGVGADGENLISLGYEFSEALPDAYFISPDAPFKYDMLPPEFAYMNSYQWFSLKDRSTPKLLEGLNNVLPILNNFIDSKLKQFNLTDENLILIGFSQGTMTSLHLALNRKTPPRAVLGYSGALVETGKKREDASNIKTEICLIHGVDDEVVPFKSLEIAEKILKYLKIPVETHAVEDIGHSISADGVEFGKEFLKRVVVGS
jgi:phospholipase/carboxylesterase